MSKSLIFKKVVNEMNNDKLKNLIDNNKNNRYFYKILKNQGESNLKIILKNLVYKEFKENKVWFYQNTIADNFFIILKGSVDIYQYEKNTINLNESLDNDKNKIKLYLEKKYSKEFVENFSKDNNWFNERKKNFRVIKISTLYQGNIFGELGLINNSRRKATVIINNDNKIDINNLNYEDFNWYNKIMMYSNKFINFDNNNHTILGCINKSLFMKICYKIDNIINLTKNKFFDNFFENYPLKHDIIKIKYYFDKIKLSEREILVKKNSKIKYLYIIVKGNLSIYDDLNPYDKIQDKNNNYKFIKWKILVRNVSINYFIGLCEIFNNEESYNFTFKAASKVKWFRITITNFKLLIKEYPYLKHYLQNYIINYDNYIVNKEKIKINYVNSLKINNKRNSKKNIKNNIKSLDRSKIRAIHIKRINNNSISKIIDHYDLISQRFSNNKKNKSNNLNIIKIKKNNYKKNLNLKNIKNKKFDIISKLTNKYKQLKKKINLIKI